MEKEESLVRGFQPGLAEGLRGGVPLSGPDPTPSGEKELSHPKSIPIPWAQRGRKLNPLSDICILKLILSEKWKKPVRIKK
jgi:hypothetical protein